MAWQYLLFHQGRRNHQAAMAYERILFRAQKCNRKRIQRLVQTIYSFSKRVGLADALIVDTALPVIQAQILRAAAQFVAEKGVSNVMICKATLELRPIEMRMALAERLRAH